MFYVFGLKVSFIWYNLMYWFNIDIDCVYKIVFKLLVFCFLNIIVLIVKMNFIVLFYCGIDWKLKFLIWYLIVEIYCSGK